MTSHDIWPWWTNKVIISSSNSLDIDKCIPFLKVLRFPIMVIQNDFLNMPESRSEKEIVTKFRRPGILQNHQLHFIATGECITAFAMLWWTCFSKHAPSPFWFIPWDPSCSAPHDVYLLCLYKSWGFSGTGLWEDFWGNQDVVLKLSQVVACSHSQLPYSWYWTLQLGTENTISSLYDNLTRHGRVKCKFRVEYT